MRNEKQMDADHVRGRGLKLRNEYDGALGGLYARTPKSVLAVIAVSFVLRNNEDDFSAVPRAIVEEWRILHVAGIIPQAPPNESDIQAAGA